MRDYLRTVSLCFEFGKTTELQSRSRESGFKPPMSDAHLTIYRAVKKQCNPIGRTIDRIDQNTNDHFTDVAKLPQNLPLTPAFVFSYGAASSRLYTLVL